MASLTASFGSAQAMNPPDRDLAAAIRLLDEGDLPGAVDALSTVVRRLSAQPGRAKDLARAHLHLGVAYALVDPPQERAAQASFREALKADATVALPADRYPAKVVRLFNAARQDVGSTSPAAPRSAAPSIPRASTPGTRVALLSMETVANQRILGEQDQQKVRAALEAVGRAAGVELVVLWQVVVRIGDVADLSSAVAARVEGAAASPPPPATPVRACVVDIERVSTGSQVGQGYARRIGELEKRIQDDGSAKQAQLTAMDGALAEMRRELDGQRAVLSPEAIDRKTRAVEDKTRERQAFLEGGQRELEQARQKAEAAAQAMNTEFQGKVKPHLDGAARDRRCDLIVTSQVALSFDPGTDLTADVIASLDAGSPRGSPPRTPADAPATVLAALDVKRVISDSARARAWKGAAEQRLKAAAVRRGDDPEKVVLDAAAGVEAEVLGQIRPYIDTVARSQSVGIILTTDVAVAIDQRADITAAVIAQIDAGTPEGKVVDVKVLRGIPLLDEAAKDAVRQWVYAPTLLNGVPVPVIMTVTANFRLQ